MDLPIRIATGLLLSSVIAGVALKRDSLSPSGAAAALVVGTATYLGGGGRWFAALMVFFVSSTLLGRVGKVAKEATKREFSKGDTRDAFQVLANGGPAALSALVYAFAPSPLWAGAFVGGLCTAAADTWATELGVLSRGKPWSLWPLRRVPRGTSGAISPAGTAATVAGAAVVAAVVAIGNAWLWLPIGTAAGLFGSLADSVLGATVQSGYHCEACQRDTEGPTHHCGADTTLVKGARWCDNDVVNLAATLLGAAAGAGFSALT